MQSCVILCSCVELFTEFVNFLVCASVNSYCVSMKKKLIDILCLKLGMEVKKPNRGTFLRQSCIESSNDIYH